MTKTVWNINNSVMERYGLTMFAWFCFKDICLRQLLLFTTGKIIEEKSMERESCFGLYGSSSMWLAWQEGGHS